jgi:dTDP-4-amino-4,6-dideoxygalactose transaminase
MLKAGPGAYVFGKEEIEQVNDVLKAGYLSRNGDLNDPNFTKKVYTLEKEFAAYSGVKYCLATNSGTGSLLISLKVLGIGPGDEVLVPAYTYLATYTSTIYAGAMPVLTEIDESLTMDPDDIEHRITKKTKAIMPVHMLGNPANMDAIKSIAKKYNLYIIEDCAQAIGASYKGRKVGSIGDMGAGSLNNFKTITSGEGGFVITDDYELYRKAYGYHDQGNTPYRAGTIEKSGRIIGFNFRISELTGAVALAQVRKLDMIMGTLRKNKAVLKEALKDLKGFSYRKLNDPKGECATLLTLILPTKDKAQKIAGRLGTQTLDNSGWHVYYNMEHILKYFEDNGIKIERGSFPKTDSILERSINITVGVICPGIQAMFGININSTQKEIAEKALELRRIIGEYQ